MPRRKKSNEPPPGTFRPGLPEDAQAVLKMFAIAARVATDHPDSLTDVNDTLQRLTGDLVPPESVTAEECARLWTFFQRAVASPKTKLREAAGRAFYNDLDSLGQRMDLAPLASWSRLPRGIDAGEAGEKEGTQTAVTLDAVRRRAKKTLDELKGKKLEAREVGELLKTLDRRDLEELFTKLVGEGIMGRAEGSMLVRWLSKGSELTDDDEALIEFLERLGMWLGENGK
jgi:hypothetical protein